MPAERLYYADSTLSEFHATVTDIREHSRGIWQLALDRTVFYPTSGGQPHDTGTLTAVSPGGARLEAAITSVEEDDSGEIWHTTAKPLNAGTAVTGSLDRDRRLDHMQQHSGQHLLSAAFLRECNAPTVSFHLGACSSTIDLAIAELAPEQVESVERLANQVIAEARPIDWQTLPRAEAETLFASGALRKLPGREGPIRIIRIADFDLNACGGTHASNTAQLAPLLLRSVEKNKRGVRVEFLAGTRALRAARKDFTTLAQLKRALSTHQDALLDSVDRLQQKAKELAKLQRTLQKSS